MPKRANRLILPLLLLLAFLLLAFSGCSTENGDTPKNDNAAASNDDSAKNDLSAKKQRHLLELRNAVVECFKRKSISGEVRGISIEENIGELSFLNIVAVDTGGDSLIYLVVHDLEDKDGNKYQRAEPLNSTNRYVMELLQGRKPTVVQLEQPASE